MLVMERKPDIHVASRRDAELRVKRNEIVFSDAAGDRVRIQVTVHNVGDVPSEPTTMTIESAPFGAFVEWRPLSQLAVPVIRPGQSLELGVEVPRPRPATLGDFNRLPPRRLLAALSGADLPLGPRGIRALLEWMFTRRPATSPQSGSPTATPLAPDIWDLLGRRQPHWVGNINVFIGPRPVERHLAKALRVFRGRTNLAMFLVGNPGNRETFAFELVGLDAAWNGALYDVTNARSLEVGPASAYLEETKWVASNGGLLVVLAVQPPDDCAAGNLAVHVTRRADQQTAIVEFDLDPAAQGPGCYTI